MVMVLVPLAVIVVVEPVRVDSAASAEPATPVAWNVTGARLAHDAVRLSAPALVPRVQLPTVATPLALVTAGAPVTAPPPLATAKVTDAPGTGRPFASVTRTLGSTDTALPATADCASPAWSTIRAGGAAIMKWNVLLQRSTRRPALPRTFQVRAT